MKRAVVIRTFGDPEFGDAVANVMAADSARVIPLNTKELETVKAELSKLQARDGVRQYGDSVRWESVAGAMALKYAPEHHSKAYWIVLRTWAMLWLSILDWYGYFSAWNRGRLQ